MSQFTVEPAELRAYADYMRTLAGQFDSIKQFATDEGCNTSGFTGLLAILQPAVEGVGDLYGATLDFGRDRLNGSADGLVHTAESYENTDRTHAADLDAQIGGN
jgi:excreted virulence factor EspC (type VII ESX diderm)